MFPEEFQIDLAGAINAFVDWLVIHYGDAFQSAANGLLVVLTALERALRAAPWWLVIAVIAGLAWLASKRLVVAGGSAVAMFLIGVLGLWDMAMQTLALMLVAVALSVLIGVPLGAALSRSRRARAAAGPVLDAMQTMPSFVYLIPAVLLFGLGPVPAIAATVIYATPPVIRLTDLGLRQVDSEILEAADAFGATPWQKLLRVQLPLALPSIMTGVNQTIMMALSMVVIASMIGAQGLGMQVLIGIQQLDVGSGLAAGIGIVLLAIVLDRITQAMAQRPAAAPPPPDIPTAPASPGRALTVRPS